MLENAENKTLETAPAAPPEPDFINRTSLSSKAFGFIWELMKIFAVAFVIVFVVKTFLMQPFCVKGASMESTFNNEDYILIDRLSYHFTDPKRGEVVVFRYPNDPSQFFIKRIIGLPGETVEIKNNEVTIFNAEHPDGMKLGESYLTTDQRTQPNQKVAVPENKYYVMGDNRLHSSDSRFWGTLDRSYITGREFARILTRSRFCHLIGQETS